MKLLDKAASIVNQGVSSASKGTQSFTIKANIAEAEKSKNAAVLNLGSAVLASLRDDSEFRTKFAGYLQTIETIEMQIDSMQRKLVEINLPTYSNVPKEMLCTCGSILGPEDAFCLVCGKKVETQAVPQQPLHNIPSAQNSLCSKCSAVLSEGELFCMMCGTPVNVTPANINSGELKEETKTCNSCGEEIPCASKFCTNCGAAS